jgi:hypothetical protein
MNINLMKVWIDDTSGPILLGPLLLYKYLSWNAYCTCVMVADNNLFHKLLNVIRKINDFDIFFESMNILLCVVQLHMSPFNSPKGDTFFVCQMYKGNTCATLKTTHGGSLD